MRIAIFFREMCKNRPAATSLGFLVLLACVSLFPQLFSSYSPAGLDYEHILEGPGAAHWMGTDLLGRDVFARLMYGARVSLAVGVGTSFLSLLVGTTYGLVAGYARPWVDNLMMRFVDLFYGLPELIIFVLLSLVLGRNVFGLMISLALVVWVRFARVTRGQVLQVKEFSFVEAARAAGASPARILTRHILPNILAPVLVTVTFTIPAMILAESTLSFIGLGINDPYSAWGTSWGTLAQDGWRAMRTYPHIIVFPALAIFLTILSFNFIGNAARDILDPKTSARRA
jgi:oligopeptide transport system permease protein